LHTCVDDQFSEFQVADNMSLDPSEPCC
jgi:hypothetical protein